MEKDLDLLEQAMSQLHRAMSRHRRWEQIALQIGVNLDQTSGVILLVLADPASRHCRLHEIAEKLSVEAPVVTRKAQLLEKAGLLSKTVDEKDARAYTLALSPEGQEVARRLKRAKRDRLANTLSEWSEQDRQQLAHYIQKFADSINNANAPHKTNHI